ncbi:hypothetical protein AQUCO_05800101v1 [Aquilegia coerulea]|uniref:ENTH domain-containing protein n=1 Tax=Aquilegia coerulea TaxID=218851 RepID=A0A2G5CG47_AQUCA|nr:hypothetical protein AQUCO_05800101v1 [Aquilegia coerulea]
MKKALDQTIRDLKRGVNKKVLKVPGIEQKVLDATSNEPWGPHGSHLADIAQATRNYHEYQMIMAVIWKRINDTGKNWRHVYKALTILEYLVAHGSERVIDEIKEHAYQISTLSDFQYVDSSGRDQGSNVRKKSQSLVVLVNDKERILEVRQKASANREKFRNTSAPGGMYRPGSGSYSSTGGYDDDRYRDDDRNGYGREREWGKDDDRYSRDGDRNGRDSDDRYSRDGYRDDDYRGRSRSIDEYQYGSRSRSSDGYRDRNFDDDGRYSTSSGARAEDHSQDDRRLERKFSEQNIGAPSPPPPYEEAVSDTRSPVHDERDGETAEGTAPKASSPTGSMDQGPAADVVGTAASPANQEFNGFDEFDPRGPTSAPPPTTHNGEVDLLGSLSDSFSSNALALIPATSATTTSEADIPSSGSGPTFVALSSASTVLNQPVQDPFGESPFKATPTTDNIQGQSHNGASISNFQPTAVNSEPQQAGPQMETVTSFDFGETFSGITYAPSSVGDMQVSSMNSQLALPDPSDYNQNNDILANILPPSEPTAPVASQAAFSAPNGPFVQQQNAGHGNFLAQGGYTAAPGASQGAFYAPTSQPGQQNNNVVGNMLPQMGQTTGLASYQAPHATTGLSTNTQPPPKKFETKSTVWADTLSKGLVNLNISGPKTNPLADIGVDFDSINRKEKREKPTPQTAVTSTITMGKAMGSGSGMGRAGANSLVPSQNSGMGMGGAPGMGMGMGGAPGMGMGMGGAPGMGMGMGGTPGMGMGMGGAPGMGMGMGGAPGMGMGMGGAPGMGMGMNMNMGGYAGMNQPMGMGMGMNMGVGQGGQMRPPGPNMPGNYNPMMGQGGYPQQPYGGYR